MSCRPTPSGSGPDRTFVTRAAPKLEFRRAQCRMFVFTITSRVQNECPCFNKCDTQDGLRMKLVQCLVQFLFVSFT